MNERNEDNKNEDLNINSIKEIGGTQAKKDKDEIQITISLEAEERLQKELQKINLNFEFSRVTRKHLVIYIINNALAHFTDEDIQAVRQSTLTDQALFDKLSRDIRESGAMPKEIREFLWKSLNLTQGPKKSKKPGQIRHSNAMSDDLEAT
jgi:hypothetical protein